MRGNRLGGRLARLPLAACALAVALQAMLPLSARAEDAAATAAGAEAGSQAPPDPRTTAEPGTEPAATTPKEPVQEAEVKEALEEELLEKEAASEEVTYIPLIGRDRWLYDWRNGSHLARKDGRFDLLFGAQGQLDGAGFHLDEGLKRSGAGGWDDDVDFRRLRLYAQGIAFTRFLFRFAYDFEDRELKEALIGLRGLGRLGTVRVGYMKEPFSLEAATSLRNHVFMERSLASGLVPGRNTGVLVSKTLLEQRLHLGAGAFFLSESLNEKDDTDGLDNDWEITLRASGVPLSSDDGSEMLLLGFSYSHTFTNADGVTFGQPPESSLVDPLIVTPKIDDLDGGDRFGVEAAWLSGSLSLQSEALGLVLQRKNGPNLFFWGGYAQVSYFLTGERRIYGRPSGAFGRVIPGNPFQPTAGHWGAFEVAARVSTLDITDEEIRGGQQTNFTLGLNWYLFSNVRMSANYLHGRVYGQGDIDILQARLQIDF